jgi:hypothetical protein
MGRTGRSAGGRPYNGRKVPCQKADSENCDLKNIFKEKAVEYYYKTGSNLQDLAHEVNSMMKEGWSPIGGIVIDYGFENVMMLGRGHGGLSMNKKRYIQAMVKKVNEDFVEQKQEPQ